MPKSTNVEEIARFYLKHEQIMVYADGYLFLMCNTFLLNKGIL
ncbi:MAG: hypothetical protein QW769_10065 [Nitrososphaerales archaeon]